MKSKNGKSNHIIFSKCQGSIALHYVISVEEIIELD